MTRFFMLDMCLFAIFVGSTQDCAKNWAVDAVRMLLDAGANPALRDDAGFTALLVVNCTDEIKSSESKQEAAKEVANLLLKAGAGTCTTNVAGFTMFHPNSRKYIQCEGLHAACQTDGMHNNTQQFDRSAAHSVFILLIRALR